MGGSFFVSVRIVEHEFVVLDVLGEPVNFYLGLVNLNAGIEAAYCVNFALKDLFFK